MAKTTDTLYRQWELLRSIPVYPNKASTRHLSDMMEREGYGCSKRTVERDLERLSSVFAIECDVDGNTNKWWREKGAVDDTLIVLTPTAALGIVLALPHLSGLLAPKFLQRLEPWVKHAKNVLDNPREDQYQIISNRILSIARGPQLRAPEIDASVLNVVYQAMADGYLVDLEHMRRGQGDLKKYRLAISGIVNREGVLYLVAAHHNRPRQLRQFALHRTRAAESVPVKYKPVSLDELNAYVDKEFRYPGTEHKLNEIRIELSITKYVAQHLAERPLSDDQVIELAENDEDDYVTATVKNNFELRWWLLGFGSNIEVIRPVELRNEIALEISHMNSYYGDENDADV